MQNQEKQWTRKILGNKDLGEVINSQRNFVEKEIKMISIANFPGRPEASLNLSLGDPSISPQFRTSKRHLEILSESVGKIDGETSFSGIESTRQALAQKFSTKFHNITKDNVYIGKGCGHAIWTVMNLLNKPGHNFVCPSPCFTLSVNIGKLIGLESRFYYLDADKKWEANISEMQKLIDEKTQFIIVNDPSNPLGSCWPAKHKREIIQLSIRKKIPLLCDEIYQGMNYGQTVPTFAELVHESEVDKVTIFKCSGISKTYLAPGWRLGWIILYASKQIQNYYNPFIKNILNVLQMPTTIMQIAVPSFLQINEKDKRLKECMDLLKINQQLLQSGLQKLDYCHFIEPSGAIYAVIMIHLEKFNPNSIKDINEFAKLLYAQENVLLFSGAHFQGTIPFIRLVISTHQTKIEEFLVRFKRFCLHHLQKR